MLVTDLDRFLAPNVRPCNLNKTHNNLIAPADTDTVTLSSSLVITNQSIGVASTAQGFNGVDGILGFVISTTIAAIIDYLLFPELDLLILLQVSIHLVIFETSSSRIQ